MSSGVEADIALDAAVIASLGLIRVLGGTAGIAAAGTGTLAAFAEERAEVRARRLREVRHHEQAIGEVLDRNARIAALAAAAERQDAEISLPTPLEPARLTADELLAWCAEADAGLAVAEESLALAIAGAAAGRIFTAEPSAVGTTPAEDRTAAARSQTLAATITRVLARLLPDTTEEDRRRVTEAAEQAAGAATPTEAESLLTEVRIRIQDANETARRRREDRAAAARFGRELSAHPAAETVRRALADVADGIRPFDDGLRTEALRLVSDLQRQAEHQYIAATLRTAFENLGYEVSEGFETLTAQSGDAMLTRGDWAQHAVRVRVDDARQVRMVLTRTEPADSDEQRRLDLEREEQWCASFDAARERLAEAGIHADVRWRVEPGEQRLPVAERPRSRQQTRVHRREHER